MVAEKTAKNFRGLLFSAAPCTKSSKVLNAHWAWMACLVSLTRWCNMQHNWQYDKWQ